MYRADRRPQVRQCLGFCSGDGLSLQVTVADDVLAALKLLMDRFMNFVHSDTSCVGEDRPAVLHLHEVIGAAADR